MNELEAAILKAFLDMRGPETLLKLVASTLPRDRAITILDAEYAAAEEGARLAEKEKFGK